MINPRLSPQWRSLSTKERFEKSYEKKSNGCWEWVAALHTTGYGIIRKKGSKQPTLTHILSWELHHGARNDLCVLHKCDNRKCVNPEHLFLGTRKDNNKDRDSKGRGPRGERNWCAKLTPENIPVIIEMRKIGMKQWDIADRFGVSQGTISHILSGSTWKHLKQGE